jgi:hypothetical protein
MKKTILAVVITLCALTQIQAQKTSSIFVELAGPGLASVNYDMRFGKQQNGFGFRAGIGGFKVEESSVFTIPVALNYLLGKDQRNYFELGIGATYASYKDTYSFDPSLNERFSEVFGHLNFGYRLAPKDGGFMFRAAINPLFGSKELFGDGGFNPFYGGIGFGYKF